MTHPSLAVIALFAGALMSGAANAQVTLGAGAIVMPQYEGSADFAVRAAPTLSYRAERFSLRTNGPGVELDLAPSRAFDAGPIVRYSFGRDGADIDNARVAALPDIDGGLELGGYAQLNVPIGGVQTFLAPRLSVVQGVSGGARGTLVEGGLGLIRRQGDWTLGARATATYASADFMNDRFGVAPGSPSGLPAYTAGAGIKDAGVSLLATYQINDQFSVVGIAGYKVLMGDAADSPIVTVGGSKEQMFLTLGLSYTFN